jgi:hypothetical protein
VTAAGAAFAQSLPRAWERTASTLWRPFDLRAWLVLAFAQLLASLPPSFPPTFGGSAGAPGGDVSTTAGGLESMWEKLAIGGCVIAFVVVALLVLTAIMVALVWVGSRGQFVFLDDVVNRRALIAEPWTRFRREGNSLFRFRCALWFAACFLVVVAMVTLISSIGIGALLHGQWGKITALALFVLAFLSLILIPLAYAAFFLTAFVVPIMHRYRVGAMEGTSRFFAIFRRDPLAFILVGLAVLVAHVAFGVAAFAFGLMTCCLGFLLLILPYVSNVVLLPFTFFYRAFTLEYLAQFDPGLLPQSPGGVAPSAASSLICQGSFPC